MNYQGIIEVFREIAREHKQINHLGIGNLFEYVESHDYEYPLVWVEPAPTTLTRNTIQFNFRFLCFDRITKDKRNEEDVHNLTLLILRDIMVLLKRKYELIDEDSTFELTPLWDNTNDEVSGWEVNFILESEITYGDCDVPTEGHSAVPVENQPLDTFDDTFDESFD